MTLRKVVVTGGAGFVGSHVAEHFSQNHHQVVVCDNLYRGQTLGKFAKSRSYNWQYLKENYPNVKLHHSDVRNFQSLQSVAKGADLIIHTAGQVAVTTSLKDPRIDFEINALGTLNVLETARENDAAVIFCSTNKVYGDNVNAIPVRAEAKRYSFENSSNKVGIGEDFSLDHTGHSPYGCSKLAADIYVQDYAHTYGLKTGVFRMSCIYGERQFGVEDQGWLAWFTIATITGKPLTIYGNGKQVRDVLYVKDLIDAFDRFLQRNVKHAVFNIGGGPQNSLSLLELLGLLQRMTGRKPKVSFSDWRAADQKVYISDIGKVRETLRWTPRVSPEEGVKRLVNWVRENRPLFDDPII
jgi:CDP-paratose 2-epimerase